MTPGHMVSGPTPDPAVRENESSSVNNSLHGSRIGQVPATAMVGEQLISGCKRHGRLANIGVRS